MPSYTSPLTSTSSLLQYPPPSSSNPLAAVPAPSPILVQELRGRQHDVKLDGCARGDEVFRFGAPRGILGRAAGGLHPTRLSSVGGKKSESE